MCKYYFEAKSKHQEVLQTSNDMKKPKCKLYVTKLKTKKNEKAYKTLHKKHAK